MAQPTVDRLLTARLTARPGLEGSVGRELRRFMDTQRREAGCLSVELRFSRDDPRSFLVLIHALACPGGLDAHVEQPLAGLLRLWSDGLLACSPELAVWEGLTPTEQRRPVNAPRPPQGHRAHPNGPQRNHAATTAEAAPQPPQAHGADLDQGGAQATAPQPRAEQPPPPAVETSQGIASAAQSPTRNVDPGIGPSVLFSPTNLGLLQLPGRLGRSATWEGMAAEDGSVTPSLCDLYAQLGGSGLGLVISGNAFVSQEGRNRPWQMGVHDDAMMPGLRRLAQAVQQAGAKAVVQISHAGCNASLSGGLIAKGPSAGQSDRDVGCQALTAGEIRQIGLDFAKAAVRVRQAGFDGVQIHAAHGYLLSQFLSPAYNQRHDEYGGALDNRARLLLEVAQLVRDAVGDGFPVLVKLNAEDFVEKGLTLEQSLEVAKRLSEVGVDAIELSGGTPRSGLFAPSRKGRITDPTRQVYYRPHAVAFRERVGLPLMLTGGVRNLSAAEELVSDGLACVIGLSRPLIREPRLAARWNGSDTSDARCVSCNRCSAAAQAGKGLYCVLDVEGGGEDESY